MTLGTLKTKVPCAGEANEASDVCRNCSFRRVSRGNIDSFIVRQRAEAHLRSYPLLRANH